MAVIQLVLEQKMKQDIIRKLKNAGFIDGDNLANDTITREDTTFWQGILENATAAKNKSYIVYDIQPSREKIFGDGEGVVSELYCNINLYTIFSSESEATFNLRKSIEEEFTSDLWSIEFNLYEYDIGSKLHHYSYTVRALYGSE